MAFRTGYENLPAAISDAFKTYWGRKEGQEERKFRTEEGQLDRESRMKELQAQLRSGELTASERNKVMKEIEQMGIDAGKYETSAVSLTQYDMTKKDTTRVLLDEADGRIEKAMNKIMKEIKGADGKWSYKKLAEKYPDLPFQKIDSWQEKNMKDDINLAFDFFRKLVTEEVMMEYRMDTPLTDNDLRPYFTENKYLTMESQWDQEKYDIEEEKTPLFDGEPISEITPLTEFGEKPLYPEPRMFGEEEQRQRLKMMQERR